MVNNNTIYTTSVVTGFRCFTFGIGSGASTALVEGLTRTGHGSAEFVKEDERLQPKVHSALSKSRKSAVLCTKTSVIISS